MASHDPKRTFKRPPNPYTTLRAKTIPDARKQESLEACRRRADSRYEEDMGEDAEDDWDQEGGGGMSSDDEAGSGGGG